MTDHDKPLKSPWEIYLDVLKRLIFIITHLCDRKDLNTHLLSCRFDK